MKTNDVRTFAEVLRVIEKRSTCARLHVAALLVRDSRIVSSGWNGVPSGMKHCNELFTGSPADWDEKTKRDHHIFSEGFEIHAEANALSAAAKNGVSTSGCSMLTSISPCSNCAKLIIAAGVTEIYYTKAYDRDTKPLELLELCGVKYYLISDVN